MTEHLPECPVWRCCKPDERATMHTCICPYDERIVGLITRQRAEQIGRNIGQYGCVINEQRHLPECPWAPHECDEEMCERCDRGCYCNELRACEQRVQKIAYQQGLGAGSDEHRQHEAGFVKGYAAALDTAREAVAVIRGKWVFGPRIYKHEALTAIDALKEKS